MEPTTAAMIAKAAIAVGTNKKVLTGIASVIVGICIPFILAIVCILNLASAAADHNRAAVRLAFHGGIAPLSMPADYKGYIYKMQQSFEWIDAAMDEIDAVAEGDVQDRYLVKAVFYSLYFGEDWLWLGESDYRRFAESFVNFEERTRTVTNEDGTQSLETYQASIAITDKVELFERIKDHYGVAATYEQQSNAMNVWHIAKYNTTAPQEGDCFDGWVGWNGGGDVTYYDLPASEVGGKVVDASYSKGKVVYRNLFDEDKQVLYGRPQ